MLQAQSYSGLAATLLLLMRSPAVHADYVYNGNYVTYCGQFDAANTTSGLYDIINNAWGDDGSGLTCTTTYLGESTDTFAVFNSTWRWFDTPTEVHSYPDALLNTALFPLVFSDLTSLKLAANWAVVPSPSDETTTNEATLASLDVVANVALDVFLDEDASTASDAATAAYEIMIWQSAYGNIQPIGKFPFNIQCLSEVNRASTLYEGPNANGQTVFTWYPDRNLSSISVDYLPLLETLRGAQIPSTAYVGRYQWGSETKHSAANQNITFIVNTLTMSVN
ncbi:putative glycosyl transferase protein [Neofusicoccum parvum UCRNP2]|uniref:Putative glycosyl transferase protein n=1 Tax=Botryosphaeria parva (strain UCR-NP2) TaxID=1287680 RepID=R1G078_BOTPV|nr:putative glycosyl transferase protein [Neofusicoccum parvum UCRNP2]